MRTPAGALELLSYTTATLIGDNQYTLTGLYRGLYGTYAADLPAGSQFFALAAGTFFYEVLPSQFVGQTLYFEFPSFNPTGGGAQPISETTICSYVPVGSSVIPGLFPQLVLRDAGVPSEVGSDNVRHDIIVAVEER